MVSFQDTYLCGEYSLSGNIQYDEIYYHNIIVSLYNPTNQKPILEGIEYTPHSCKKSLTKPNDRHGMDT